MTSFEYLLEFTAVITTVCQFLSPIITCRKYFAKKSTGESSGFPFICGFLSCSLWLRYGFLTDEKIVIIVNIIGTILMLSYSIIYYVFTVNKKNYVRQFAIAFIFLITVILYTNHEKDVDQAIIVSGYICCFVTVIFFAAPLIMLVHIIKTKNTESLPFPLIVASFIVSLQWFIYGLLINDAFIQIPNLLGCILSASQLGLFVCYPAKSFSGQGYKLVEKVEVL